MQHLVAYYQSVDQGAALAAINGVADPILFVNGTTVRVPSDLPFLAGASLITPATTITAAQIQTPTLRDTFYPNISPLDNVLAGSSLLPPQLYRPNAPLPLTGLEQMQFYSNTDNAGAVAIYGLVWLQDAPQAPVEGEILTIRATGAATLVAGTWVNTNLTFDQVLPVGDYQVVGLRVEGANLVAARLVFQGYNWRPGVRGRATAIVLDDPMHRHGRAGVLGTFNNNVPPTLDCMGATDTTQVVYLDLIKAG